MHILETNEEKSLSNKIEGIKKNQMKLLEWK